MDVGVRLKQAREARGMSIAALSAITRLPQRWLETIERNDPTVLPPGPYGRSYVRTYAREVGLDPDRTAREYFAQFEATPDPAPAIPVTPAVHSDIERRAMLSPLAVTVVLVGIVLAALALRGWRDEPRSRPEAGAIGTAGNLAADPASRSTPAQPPASPPRDGAITVTLAAEQSAWISATADGKRVIYRLLAPGDRETLHGNRVVTIRVGNAGAVRWTVGGRDAGPMGATGAVRTVSVTPENLTTIR